jgi:hypothetical protein
MQPLVAYISQRPLRQRDLHPPIDPDDAQRREAVLLDDNATTLFLSDVLPGACEGRQRHRKGRNAAHHLGPRRVIVRSRDGHNDAVDNAVDDANDDLVVLRVIHHRAAHPSTITAHCPAESPQMPWTAALCCSRIIMH